MTTDKVNQETELKEMLEKFIQSPLNKDQDIRVAFKLLISNAIELLQTTFKIGQKSLRNEIENNFIDVFAMKGFEASEYPEDYPKEDHISTKRLKKYVLAFYKDTPWETELTQGNLNYFKSQGIPATKSEFTREELAIILASKFYEDLKLKDIISLIKIGPQRIIGHIIGLKNRKPKDFLEKIYKIEDENVDIEEICFMSLLAGAVITAMVRKIHPTLNTD